MTHKAIALSPCAAAIYDPAPGANNAAGISIVGSGAFICINDSEALYALREAIGQVLLARHDPRFTLQSPNDSEVKIW